MSKIFPEKKFKYPGVQFMRVNTGSKGKGAYLWKVKVWEVLTEHENSYERVGLEFDVKLLTNIKRFRADNFVNFKPISMDAEGVRDLTNKFKNTIEGLGMSANTRISPSMAIKRAIEMATDTTTHTIPDEVMLEWENAIRRMFSGQVLLKKDNRGDWYYSDKSIGTLYAMYVGQISKVEHVAKAVDVDDE